MKSEVSSVKSLRLRPATDACLPRGGASAQGRRGERRIYALLIGSSESVSCCTAESASRECARPKRTGSGKYVTVFGARTDDTMEADRLIEIDDRWMPDEAFLQGRYPEGARTKTRYLSPSDFVDSLIRKRHWYLFKESKDRTPWQFWMEVMAYRIGLLMGVAVPPAYVARAGRREDGMPKYGALIEWFFDEARDRYVTGSLLIAPMIPGFDFKKGKQHNFQTNLQCFRRLRWFHDLKEVDLVRAWAPILAFDTVIGNTDRHQDNWGIVLSPVGSGGARPEGFDDGRNTPEGDGGILQSIPVVVHLSPAFDNGTAMSYELPEERFTTFDDEQRVFRYLTYKRAHHHMTWSLDDTRPCPFHEFVGRLVETYPYVREDVTKCLTHLTIEAMRAVLSGLPRIGAEGDGALTETRLAFTIKMMDARAKLLRERLGIV